jgi:hypothetical protein
MKIDLLRDARKALEVHHAGIRAVAGQHELRLVLAGLGLEIVVVDQAFVGDAI